MPQGRTFLDRELSLPKEWAHDAARRKEAGVPADVPFRTKPQLARAMLERAFQAGVPAGWVTGDEVYGRDRRLRMWLEQRHQPFVLAVAANEPWWCLTPQGATADRGGRQHRGDPARRVGAAVGRERRQGATAPRLDAGPPGAARRTGAQALATGSPQRGGPDGPGLLRRLRPGGHPA